MLLFLQMSVPWSSAPQAFNFLELGMSPLSDWWITGVLCNVKLEILTFSLRGSLNN